MFGYDLETVAGFIMMLVIAPIGGNYATSFVHRLPRGKTPFETHPFCPSCQTELQPADLFPILSYCLLGGKCRYCKAKIPISYTLIELASLVMIMSLYLLMGISELFILQSLLLVELLTLAALEYESKKLNLWVLTYAFFTAALMRVLQEGTIFSAIQSGFLMMMLAVVFWKLGGIKLPESAKDKGYVVPDAVVLAALTGVALPLYLAAQLVVAAGVVHVVMHKLTRIYVPSAWVLLSIFAGLLWPHIETIIPL